MRWPFSYTLAFIKRGDEILLVNRKKKPWLGSWNGVGGKRQNDEQPIACIRREISEETGIVVDQKDILYKGYMTWNTFDANGQGLYLFLIDLPQDFKYQTPIHTDEGILDWKPTTWILDKDNYGIAHNIPYFLPKMLNEQTHHHYHCTFEQGKLISVTAEAI
jgi:8-oxo-dGTP diphosphatase